MRHAILCSSLVLSVAAAAQAQTPTLVLSPSPTTAIVAGTGTRGYAGDNASATLARLAAPGAIVRDASGNLYIADTQNHRVRRISPAGVIDTFAGTGVQGYSGDNGPAVTAELDSPGGVAITADGSLYIADTHNQRIRQVDADGIIHTIAGTGTRGFVGDGLPATGAQFSNPQGIAVGLAGDLYVADTGNQRIRRVASNGLIATVAGDGVQDTGLAGSAVTTHLDSPTGVAVRADGSVVIADRRNSRVLILNTDGTLQLLAAGSVTFRRPSSLATNGAADTLIADTGNDRVARVTTAGAAVVLGSGTQGIAAAGSAPSQTALGAPSGVLPSVSPLTTGIDFSALDRDNNQLVSVALPRLSFATTAVATTSPKQTITLANCGTSALTVAALKVPSSFSVASTSSCTTVPFVLVENATCNLDLTFTPATIGSVEALLEVDVTGAVPHNVLLGGTGVQSGTALASSTALQLSGNVVYAGSPLNLTALVLGTSNAAPTGTITFVDGASQIGQAPLNSAAQSVLSTAGLQAGSHTLQAQYSGDAVYQPSTSAQSTVTVVAPPDFSFSVSGATRIALSSGSAGAVALVLQPMNGTLNQTVSITVSGLPANTTLNVTPVPVLLAGDPLNVNVSFKLPVVLSATTRTPMYFGLLVPWLLFVPRRRLRTTLMSTATLVAVFGLQGCGGGYLGGASTSAQSAGSTYAVTVTATCNGVTGQPIVHTATFTLVVQS